MPAAPLPKNLSKIQHALNEHPNIGLAELSQQFVITEYRLRNLFHSGVLMRPQPLGKTRPRKCTIEVMPYDQADWAPAFNGTSFDWAYRVTAPSGDSLTAAVKGSKKFAKDKAQRAADRLLHLARGEW